MTDDPVDRPTGEVFADATQTMGASGDVIRLSRVQVGFLRFAGRWQDQAWMVASARRRSKPMTGCRQT